MDTGARLVVDDELLAEMAREPVAQQPALEIGAAAGPMVSSDSTHSTSQAPLPVSVRTSLETRVSIRRRLARKEGSPRRMIAA